MPRKTRATPPARLARLEAERLYRRDEREKQRNKRQHVVYFLLCEGFVKIGYGYDPLRRLYAAQTLNPFPVTLAATALGGEQEERVLHRAFKELHVRAEWFRLATPLDAVIDTLQQINDPADAMEWLGEWLLATKGSFALLKTTAQIPAQERWTHEVAEE